VRRSADFGAFLLCALGAAARPLSLRRPTPVRPAELAHAGQPPPRSRRLRPPTAAPISLPATLQSRLRSAAETCLEELKTSHVEVEPASMPEPPSPACTIAAPVRIMRSACLTRNSWTSRPIRCSTAVSPSPSLGLCVNSSRRSRGHRWAPRSFALETGPGYYCRTIDRVAGAKISPHGTGYAIDVSAILLADRRRVAVGHEAESARSPVMQTIPRAGLRMVHDHIGPRRPGPCRAFPLGHSCATAPATTIGSANSPALLRLRQLRERQGLNWL